MCKHEDRFVQAMNLSKSSSIVCFGVGRLFELRKYFFTEENLCGRILAVVDNDIDKLGTQVKIADSFFKVKSFEELVHLKQNHDFVIVVTAASFKEIDKQIKACSGLDGVEVIDGRYVLQDRKNYLASYSNIFCENQTDVGQNGENMTMSILAHNRTELTLRLLDSIEEFMPKYEGEILIGDNGSDKEELLILEKKLKNINLNWRILKFNRHYPIPIGKNMVNKECKTDWIFQLDNDMYLTGDPVFEMNQSISKLGCNIWGIPYYDAQSGRVGNYVSNLEFVFDEEGNKRLTCLNDLQFYTDKNGQKPMLCTYTAGGASLMRKDFFIQMNGYDENIFVNEDMEFIYRVNMQGYKIGNMGIKCLVHDHKLLGNESGKRYEAIRFDEERIRESKKYLKEKYGFEFV